MTLIPCPACERQVSAQAISCPQCGHPLVEHAVVNQATAVSVEAISPSSMEVESTTPPLSRLQQLAIWHKVLLYSWIYWCIIGSILFLMDGYSDFAPDVSFWLLLVLAAFRAVVHFQLMRLSNWPLWVSLPLLAISLVPAVAVYATIFFQVCARTVLREGGVPMGWFGADLRRVS